MGICMGIFIGILMEIFLGIFMGIFMGISIGIWMAILMGILMMDSMGWPRILEGTACQLLAPAKVFVLQPRLFWPFVKQNAFLMQFCPF